MGVTDTAKIQTAIIEVIKNVCKRQKIDEEVNAEFCPGKFIMSHVLVSIVPEIEIKTGLAVPIECYIFHDNNKDREQLSIKNVVSKLLKVAKHE